VREKKMIKYFCDICEKEFKKDQLLIRILYYSFDNYTLESNLRKKPEEITKNLSQVEFMVCYRCDKNLIEEFNNFLKKELFLTINRQFHVKEKKKDD
jgi:hypothetical protein